MKNLNILQINNLIVGNTLAVEIPIEREGFKAFVVVWAHHKDIEINISKTLNNRKKSELVFDILKCEIEEQYINTWDTDYYIQNETHIKDIEGIKELEVVLLKYLDDLTKLGSNVEHPY